MMKCVHTCVILFMCILHVAMTDEDTQQPTIKLVSCLSGTIVLQVLNCWNDGLMYIKDDITAYNMQFTTNGTVIYACAFHECNLAWNTQFTFVIQQNSIVQTQYDIIQSYTCVADQGDINPDNNANQNTGASDYGKFFVQTAIASMKFYGDSGQIETGSYIKLGTDVTMVIELADTYDGLIDISVKSCEASGIELILDRCPVDEDLFDIFNKTSVGTVENVFQMFRATSSSAGPVNMLFSCLLQVCYAPCRVYSCNDTDIEVERKKRQADNTGDIAKSMMVGSFFQVGIRDPVIMKKGSNTCVKIHVLTGTLSVLGFFLCLSTSTMFFYWKEWMISEKLLQAEIHRNECSISRIRIGSIIQTSNVNGIDLSMIQEREVNDTGIELSSTIPTKVSNIEGESIELSKDKLHEIKANRIELRSSTSGIE